MQLQENKLLGERQGIQKKLHKKFQAVEVKARKTKISARRRRVSMKRHSKS